MQAEFDRETLLRALQVVEAVVPAKPTREILGRVLLQFGSGGSSLSATDTELEIRHGLPVGQGESGQVLLPQQTRQILSELRCESVTLTVKKNTLRISGPGAEFMLPTSDPDEFPSVAVPSDCSTCEVTARDLRRGLQFALIATDPASTRYALGGVAFVSEPGFVLTLVATDSRRLAACSIGVTGVFPARTPPHVVPIKAMTLLLRCLPEDDTPVLFAFDDVSVSFAFGETRIKSRLLEGRFPTWQKVIPETFTRDAVGVVSVLSSAVRQSMVVATPESRGVEFAFSENTLRLSAATTNGQSRSEAIVEYAADPLTITFDPKFVLDFLKVLRHEDKVTISLNAPDSAALLSADGVRYVLMPLTDRE